MATVTVNINATDNMSPVIAALQQQLNQLQQQANINLGGRLGNQMMNYTTRLFENMLNSLGTKLWKSFTGNLKSAYEEIKAIDDELVVVRRVTGKTSEELEGMTKNAMKVAQTYGVSASKYLSGVADFTRAGYKDQAEGLAELSVKLQRAGDVSEDVANQYILAIDKAYGLQGNIQALTAAMDGANQIGNEYATNVGEISAGMGKLATIAATAHVGIDELTAALGTVTAVTQRSGTEAATALRAIFLNIMGDTTTEIEDGAKWTAGEIEGLRDVLELYAPEVVRAAEATGTLIDPMEAIGALAKSYKAGILTESKLFSMVSDIGGKLRTNQLMVLIKEWDMYESMLATYANASGSIDREVENSLDSITVKTERLKASWVALVNNTVSSRMIKGVLDGMNTAVQAVENLANALTIVLGLVIALKAQRLATLFAGITGQGAGWVAGATGTIRNFGVTLTLIGAAVSLVNGLVNDYNKKQEEAKNSALQSGKEATRSSNEIMKLYNTYITATAGTEQYTTALIALGEALGLTAEQAKNSEGSIKDLTHEQLIASEAAAKAALDTWNRKQLDTMDTLRGQIALGWRAFKDIFTLNQDDYPKIWFTSSQMSDEMWDIVEATREFAKEYGTWYDYYTDQGEFSLVPDVYTAEQLIAAYDVMYELKTRWDAYANEAKVNLTGYDGYMAVNRFLDNYKDMYESAKSMVDYYVTTIMNTKIWELPIRDEMARTMADINAGKEVDIEVLERYAAAWDEMISSITDDAYEGRGKLVRDSLIKYLGQTYPMIAKYSKEWQEFVRSGKSGFSESVDNTTKSVKTLTQALSEATKAKNEFDAAMERDAENKGFQDYQSAYTAYAEEIEAGRVNSQRAMAAARYLMAGSGTDFDTLYREKGFRGVNEFMSKGPFKTLYGDSSKAYGEGFLDVLAGLADKNTGEIKLGDKVVATYKRVNEQVEFTISDLKGLAEATHLSTDQVWDSIKALNVYGDIESDVRAFTDQLEQLGKEAGFLADVGEDGVLTIDYGKLLAFARESKMSSEDWMSMKNWLDILNEIGEIHINNVPDYEEGWQNVDDLVDSVADKADQAAESAQQAQESMENAAETAGAVEETTVSAPGGGEGGGGAVSTAQAIYDEYSRVMDEVDALIQSKDYTITFNADGAPAIQTIQTLETDAGTVTRERTIQFDVNGNIISVLDTVKDDAGAVAETREIHYDVDGNVESILVTLYDDAGRVAETRTIHYNADGTIDSIDVVRAKANDPSVTQHLIYYFSNGQVDHIDLLETNAENPSEKHHLIYYYTDGKIDHLEQVEENAGVLENKTYYIKYGANGEIEGLELVEQTADGETKKKVYQLHFGADGQLLYADVLEFTLYADGTTSDPIKYTLTADDGEAYETINAIVDYLTGSYESDWGEYVIGADPQKAYDAVNESETAITESYAKDLGSYNLKASTDGVQNALSDAEEMLEDFYNEKVPTIYAGTFQLDPIAPLDPADIRGHTIETVGPHFLWEPWFDSVGTWFRTSQFYNRLTSGGLSSGQEGKDIIGALNGYIREALSGEPKEFTPNSSPYPETHFPWDNAVKSVSDFFNWALWGEGGEHIEPPPAAYLPWQIPVEVEVDETSVDEAADTAENAFEIALGQNPAEMPVAGVKLDEESFETEDGTMVYTASFQLEDSDAVMDVLTEINDATGEVHRIKILTEADGTQTIEEFIGDIKGNGKTYSFTVDVNGNIETSVDSMEELEALASRTYSFTVSANTTSSQSRLNKLRNTLDEIKSKTITITTRTSGGGGGGGSGGSGIGFDFSSLFANAGGTRNFPGGYSLINELGAELVAANGRAYIYGNGLPTIARIPQGAQIFTAVETAEMLNGVMSMPAYAEGTTGTAALAEAIAGIMHGIAAGTTSGALTVPPPKEEEKKEEEKKSGGGGGGSSQSSDEENEEFWDTIKKYIEYGLKKIQYQIDSYQDDITAIERARDALIKPIEEELEDLDYSLTLLKYEVTLLERARDDAIKPLDKEIERLEKARDINKEDLDLEEKRQALEDARQQRTVRYYNELTGQWEWMADAKAVKDAEEAYTEALADYEITLLKRERDAIEEQYQEQIEALEEQEEILDRRVEDLEHERTKIEYEYEQSIEPLQDALDRLQEIYDDLDKYYNRLADAIEVPTEDLTAALQEMMGAEERFVAQMENTVKLLDALYALAPTWSAIDVGDIGQYTPEQGKYASYTTVDQSTTITVDGITIDGSDARTMTSILGKRGLYGKN